MKPRDAVGLAGTGLMGSAMGERLLERGFRLLVYNRTAEKAAPLAGAGARVVETPAALARGADVVCLALTDAAAAEAILHGRDGMAAALDAGNTVVNLGTVGVRPAVSLADAVAATGASYLDAPVLGSVEPARRGELLLFLGGEAGAIERARPVLEALSRRIDHLGPVGSGNAMKLTANMLLARYVEALGEVLALCRGFDLDPSRALEIIQASALASPMWEKGKVLLAGEAPLHFPLRHMAKDLRLLDEEAERLGLSLPAHEAVQEIFAEALQTELGERDYSEVVRMFERR